MSQQTQISRVAERWPQMMRLFPTPLEMSVAGEQEVLSLWQGLGYYRRAKNLKRTAEMIEKEFSGEVPSEVRELLTLPGIGKYTAGAVASIAFGKRVPIVDGNVHRVLCRLNNNAKELVPSVWTWEEAEKMVKSCNDPSILNEGLMEFGATVCSPKLPRCSECPLMNYCCSYESGTQHEVPTPKKSTKKKKLYHYAVVIESDLGIALRQRQSDGLWAGMWEVPTVESEVELTDMDVAINLELQQPIHKIGSFTHTLSHRLISFVVFRCSVKQSIKFSWFRGDSLLELPLASAQRKVLNVHCEA